MDSGRQHQEPPHVVSSGEEPDSGIDAHYSTLFSWMLRSGLWAELSQIEKAVLTTLRMRMNRQGEASVGGTRLAKDAGMSRRSVFRSTKVLREMGLIETTDSSLNYDSNKYRLIDAIPLVVYKQRVGVVRVSIAPIIQTDFLKRLRTTVAAAHMLAKASNKDLALHLAEQLEILAETELGTGILSYAVSKKTGGLSTAVLRTHVFAENLPTSCEAEAEQQKVEHDFIVTAYKRIHATQPKARTKPAILTSENLRSNIEMYSEA